MPHADDGEDTFENCIPLCLDCHAEVGAYDPKHPKGRRFTPSELKMHRNRWYEKVKNTGIVYLSDDYLKVDHRLFQKIREMLPGDTIIKFLREHDYGGSFPRIYHVPLYDFIEWSELPETEFFNATLEAMRAELESSIRQFLKACSGRIFRHHNSDWLSIPSEWLEKDKKTQQRFWDAQKTLNKLAANICEQYDKFISQGRKILCVL